MSKFGDGLEHVKAAYMTVCRLVVTLTLLLLPCSAGAQQAARISRIGVLSPAPTTAASASPFSALRDKLRELGYIEGQNIALEFRLADGHLNRLPELAADLVRLQVDVIVTDGGDSVARVAAAATKTIPIVMGTSTDPVASGLVASLARPGGNVTGFVLPYADLAGRRLQLLKEMVPTVSRVAVLWDADSGEPQLRAAAAAAPALGVHLESLPVRERADLDAAFEKARRQGAGALLQLASRRLSDNRKAIAERVLRYRLPGVFELGFAETGVLASYGPRTRDNFSRAAVYVDKILKGARPGDLPVQYPLTFYLEINLRTAKSLGLTVPPSVLLQATRIIE
jgi:putative ABC transport system substrate-binding protein